jgi:hypothetical protein
MQDSPEIGKHLPDCTELYASKLNSFNSASPVPQITQIIFYNFKVSVWMTAWKQLVFT